MLEHGKADAVPESPVFATGVRHLVAHGIQDAKGCALSGGRQKSS